MATHLNLSVSDTIKQCIIMKDCLDTSFELVKLIKYSPKRDAMLSHLKEEFRTQSVPFVLHIRQFVLNPSPALMLTMKTYSGFGKRH